MGFVRSNGNQGVKIHELRRNIIKRMQKLEDDHNKQNKVKNYLSRSNGNCIGF